MKYLDHEILVKKLDKPLGSLEYHAVMQFLCLFENGIKEDIGYQFGETYGTTEDEARKSMKKAFSVWKAKHPEYF